jgi:hypothetical protein
MTRNILEIYELIKFFYWIHILLFYNSFTFEVSDSVIALSDYGALQLYIFFRRIIY